MLETRVMPCLLMREGALVKTVQFGKHTYVGDPLNAVRIFNQKEVDELIMFDIGATTLGHGIDFVTLEKVVAECFMPICYGGGVDNLADMRRLFHLGVEKVSISSAAIVRPELVREAAAEFGSQAVVVTLDVKKNLFGRHTVRTHQGQNDTKRRAVDVALQMADAGAGELIVYSIDRDGTWSGFDLAAIKAVTDSLDLPVVACGGAGQLSDLRAAVHDAGASAVAIGSMAVFQAKDLGVLIKFPSRAQQEGILH